MILEPWQEEMLYSDAKARAEEEWLAGLEDPEDFDAQRLKFLDLVDFDDEAGTMTLSVHDDILDAEYNVVIDASDEANGLLAEYERVVKEDKYDPQDALDNMLSEAYRTGCAPEILSVIRCASRDCER